MTKVLNIKTGKLENCTVGAGCQRHAHKITVNDTLIKNVAKDLYVTEAEKVYHSGDTLGGILKEVNVKLASNGDEKKIVVVDSRLGGQAIGLNEGEHAFVQIPKEEARFMDMDKKTAALGYALFKDAFNANSQIYIAYTLYGTNGDENVYKVERI